MHQKTASFRTWKFLLHKPHLLGESRKIASWFSRFSFALAALIAIGFTPDAHSQSATTETLQEVRDMRLGTVRRLLVHLVGSNVPDHVLIRENGEETSLKDYRGKVLLVNFWATWCPPCRKEMPSLDRLQAELGGEHFEVIAINLDRHGIAMAREFYDEIGIEQLAIHVDPNARFASALRALGLPTSIIVDRDGNEIGRLVGDAEWDAPEALNIFRRLTAGNSS